jgi:hypothetical protein
MNAVTASLRMMDMGDRPVLTALWCTMFLGPLASILKPDMTIWFWGPTGSFKSTVSALFLCHFGSFERKTLPVDWSWTDNAMEKAAQSVS